MSSISYEELREEIFGTGGFAHALRQKFQLDSPEQLARQAQQQVRRRFAAKPNCSNVNDFLCALLDKEYEIYLARERKAVDGIIDFALSDPNRFPKVYRVVSECVKIVEDSSLTPTERVSKVGQALAYLYKLISEAFAQSRRTRAGGSAQYHIAYVLDALGYKGQYEMQQKLNGTVDFLFPSRAMWEKDRRRCTLVSVKRSLRERYKQVFEELGITRGLTVYLMVTETEEEAQRDITSEKVSSLNAQNVYLVVRDPIKRNRFPKETNVMGFTDFFCKELPRLRANWLAPP